MSATRRLYSATDLATATATSRVHAVDAHSRESTRAVTFTIAGTATATLQGCNTPDGTFATIGTAATASGLQHVSLPPFVRVAISGASGTPDIAVDLDASLRPDEVVSSFALSPASSSLDVSDEDTQQLTGALLNVLGETLSTGFTGVTFVSSDEELATVDAAGLVTPVAAGEATITATYTDFHGRTYADTYVATVTA